MNYNARFYNVEIIMHFKNNATLIYTVSVSNILFNILKSIFMSKAGLFLLLCHTIWFRYQDYIRLVKVAEKSLLVFESIYVLLE